MKAKFSLCTWIGFAVLLFCGAQQDQIITISHKPSGGGGGATMTLVQQNSTSCAATTTCGCVLSSAANGDVLVSELMWGNQAGTLTTSDNGTGGTNSYTPATGSPQSDGVSGGNELFVQAATNVATTGSLTITTAVAGGGSHTLRVACFDYHSTTGWQASPWDVFSATNCGGTGAQTCNGTGLANITPSANPELIVAAAIVFSPAETTFSAAGGCTLRDAGGTAGHGWASLLRADSADNLAATNTAQACIINWVSTATGYAAIQGALKPN
jgi:hypothetical protein